MKRVTIKGHAMRSIAGSAGILGFWMVAPESLRVVGQASGYGWQALLFMMLFLVLVLSSVISRRAIQNQSTPRFLQIMTLVGALATTLYGTTGMLVTAGFTFNEVFYYRFPNFGFAFLVLFGVVVVQLLTERTRMYFQTMSVGLVILVILVITILGFMQLETSSYSELPVATNSFMGLLPLIYIYLSLDENPAITEPETEEKTVIGVITGIAILLSCWMIVSFYTVGSDRLFASSIPYMNTAKSVLGQSGRLLMGGAVIIGVAGAVCGLFTLSRTKIQLIYPASLIRYRFMIPLILALIISVMLMVGVAGSQFIETYIETSILFWLISSAIVLIYQSIKDSLLFVRFVGLTSGLAYLTSSYILFTRIDEYKPGLILIGVLGSCAIIATLLTRRYQTS